MTVAVGDAAPAAELADTDGTTQRVGPADGAVATVIVFTCNHCPYALAWHDRLVDAARDYRDRDVRFVMVNSNDAERYPHDSYAAMQARVAEERWPFPYLHDESQHVARRYGAQTTPDVFVLDAAGILRYRGAPDADHADPALRALWLREALDDLLAGRDVSRAQTEPVGCSVKWRA